MNFTEQDLKQLEVKNIAKEQVLKQLQIFKKGKAYVTLAKPAILGDGIENYDAEQASYIRLYEAKKDQLDIIKFVPASGAATRMFKFLYQFLNEFDYKKETFASYVTRTQNKDVAIFSTRLPSLLFTKR